MRSIFNNRPKDPEQALREAAREGQKHGAAGAPAANPDGSLAGSFYEDQKRAEAATAADFNTAQYQSDQRPEYDRVVDEGIGEVTKRTTKTAYARKQVNVAQSKKAGADAENDGPRHAPDSPWLKSVRARHAVTVAIGLFSALAVAGALLQASQDSPLLAFAYGAGVGAVTIIVGELVGRALKRWELDNKKADSYVSHHWVPWAVVGLGVAALLSLVLAIGTIRATGARADEVRHENKDSGITLNLPGQEPPTDSTKASADKPVPTIPWWAFLPLELVMVAAAVLIAWDSFLPHIEEQQEAAQELPKLQEAWDAEHSWLGKALGGLLTAVDTRSDGDSSVHIANEGTITFADAEWAAYALADELARAGNGPSPFIDRRSAAEQATKADATDKSPTTHQLVKERLGRSIEPLGTVNVDGQAINLDDLLAETVARAVLELRQHPACPDIWQQDSAAESGPKGRNEEPPVVTPPPTTSEGGKVIDLSLADDADDDDLQDLVL